MILQGQSLKGLALQAQLGYNSLSHAQLHPFSADSSTPTLNSAGGGGQYMVVPLCCSFLLTLSAAPKLVLHRLQRIPAALTQQTSFPDLGIPLFLFQIPHASFQCSLPFLKCIFPEVPHICLRGSALVSCSCQELALSRHRVAVSLYS